MWRKVVAEFDRSAVELAVLTACCRRFDDITALDEAIASDGLIVAGSKWQPRLNQAVADVRLSPANVAYEFARSPGVPLKPLSGSKFECSYCVSVCRMPIRRRAA